jgi:hypothetical protein
MLVIYNKLKFYIKPLLIITVINFFILLFFGTYFEEYEGIFSAFIHGTYSIPYDGGWDANLNYLLLYIYEWVACFFPTYNVYGFILTVYNWFIWSLYGLILYRILIVNLKLNINWTLFIFLYFTICIDNFINLNSTRISIILISTIFGYIESRKMEGNSIKRYEWYCISILILFASFIRFETVLIFSIIYIAILFIYNKFTKSALIAIAISGVIFLIYNITVALYVKDEVKVMTYKEKDIYRNNINYTKLNKVQLLDVKAMMQYGITDKEHFTSSFYDSVSKIKSKNGFLTYINGFRQEFVISTLHSSYRESKSAIGYVLFYFVTIFLLIYKKILHRNRFIIHTLMLLLIPIFLTLFSVVPSRFLVPYLSIACCINIVLYLKFYKWSNKLHLVYSVCFLLILYNVFKEKDKYIVLNNKYKIISTKLSLLNRNQKIKKPIIINNFYSKQFFPITPFEKLIKQNALFLNLYYYIAWDFQQKSWRDVCNCNSLSLKNKLDYVIQNQNLFLIDEVSFNFIKKYMKEKYKIKIIKSNIENFDGDVIVCKLKYEL